MIEQIGDAFTNGARRSWNDADLAIQRANIITEAINKNLPTPNLPKFFTGARCKILINGLPVGVAMEVNWSVSADWDEIRTIDAFVPWELTPGQMTINASLRRVIDPLKPAASDGLYSTLQSYLHQPYASIEIRDRVSNVIFYARGIFTNLKGSVSVGSVGVESVDFVGYYFRENVVQRFSPEKKSFPDDISDRFNNSAIKRTFSSVI